jgi:MFS family permease
MSVSIPHTNLQRSYTSKQIQSALFAALIAFLTYASVYAYRKPFTVATFGDLQYWGIRYQTLLIISQVIGYMLSKFYGIKFISELKRLGRWKTSAALVGIAWLSLFFFAILPPLAGLICFLVNGFVLGFMWGIVFSYVEGRKATDFIGSAMAVSFIFAGGFTRSVAKWLLVEWNVPEKWMPFFTGLIFALPLALFIYLLERIPAPGAEDEEERTRRVSMTGADRKKVLQLFGFGVIIITITYVFLTIIRDLRDNFMANIWNDLGYGSNYAIFASTETITSVIVLVMMSLLVLVRRNIKAFRLIHLVILLGFLLAGISSFLFKYGVMNGAWWMQLVGLGLYMAYIPFNCIFFERMIATFKISGNVGFLIYIADAFGYLGSVLVMLSKEIFHLQANWSSFYSGAALFCAVVGVAGTFFSLSYFNRKYGNTRSSYYEQ